MVISGSRLTRRKKKKNAGQRGKEAVTMTTKEEQLLGEEIVVKIAYTPSVI